MYFNYNIIIFQIYVPCALLEKGIIVRGEHWRRVICTVNISSILE